MNLYKVLGLSDSCSLKDIKSNYRDLAKIYHPDKGGDEEEFKKISEAYAILSNLDLRERYDKGESLDSLQGQADGLMTRVFHIFEEVINSTYFVPDHSDLFKMMKQECNEKELKMRGDIETLQNEIKNIDSIIARFVNADVFISFMNNKKKDIMNRIEGIKEEVGFISQIINYISNCQYQFDEDKEDVNNGTHKLI